MLKTSPRKLAYLRKYHKQYYAENRESEIARVRHWYEQNRDKRRAWHRSPQGKVSEWNNYARKRLRPGATWERITVTDWQEIVEIHNNACGYCKRPFTARLPLTQDHKTPLSRGGDHTVSNVIPACWDCNRVKHLKTAEEFEVPDYEPDHEEGEDEAREMPTSADIEYKP